MLLGQVKREVRGQDRDKIQGRGRELGLRLEVKGGAGLKGADYVSLALCFVGSCGRCFKFALSQIFI